MSLRGELLVKRSIIFERHYTCSMIQLNHKRNLDLTNGQRTIELFSLSGVYNELSLYRGSLPYFFIRLLSERRISYYHTWNFIICTSLSDSCSIVRWPIIAQLYLWSKKYKCPWKTTELISIEFYLFCISVGMSLSPCQLHLNSKSL